MPPRRNVPTLDPSIGRDAPTPPPGPADNPAARQTRRKPHLPKPVTPTSRVTVDVPTPDHRALKRTADDLADELGVGNVPVGHVMAALAHLVTADTHLREAVTTYLRERVEE